jgi:hypothetical protein
MPSPLDPLSQRERGPFRAPGLRLPIAHAERGRGGQEGEVMFKLKTDPPENIGLFAGSSYRGETPSAEETTHIPDLLLLRP